MQNKSPLAFIMEYLPAFILFAIPLFFLTLTLNPWNTPKVALLFVALITMVVLWLIPVMTKRQFETSRSPLHLPLILFVLAITTSLIMSPEGRIEALVGKGGLLLILSGLAYFITLVPVSPKVLKSAIWALIAGSSLLALHSILQLTFLHSLTSLPAYMQTRAFTLTGSPLVSISLLILGIVASVMLSLKEKSGLARSISTVAGVIQTIALIAYLALIMQSGVLALNLLPYSASWSLTLDALKFPKALFAGVGITNFPYLYTQFKPLTINASPLWNTLPSSATSEFLQLTITAGLFGLLTFLSLPVTALLNLRHNHSAEKSILGGVTLSTLIILLFTPASVPVLTILFIVIALIAPRENKTSELSGLTPWLLALAMAGLVISTSYWVIRVLGAEYHMAEAGVALRNNEGKAVYDHHVRAITLMPHLAPYRLSYASVNMSLATTLSQKQGLTDADKSNIAQLVSQAVREARVATQLHPSDARNWTSLGGIYRNLITSTTGADEFAKSSFERAISADAANPTLRVEYGGLLYQLSELATDKDAKTLLLNQAIQQFQTGAQLKSDYANAYYNLSKALEKAGNLAASYTALERAVASLSPDSPDLGTATSELSALKAKLEASKPTQPETTAEDKSSDLALPSPLPTPIQGAPADLDEPTTQP